MSPERSGQPFRPVWPQGCWPNEVQRLLLEACLLEDQVAAQEAFRAWAGKVDLLFVDNGSHMLLLMLYERFRQWNIDHARLLLL